MSVVDAEASGSSQKNKVSTRNEYSHIRQLIRQKIYSVKEPRKCQMQPEVARTDTAEKVEKQMWHPLMKTAWGAGCTRWWREQQEILLKTISPASLCVTSCEAGENGRAKRRVSRCWACGHRRVCGAGTTWEAGVGTERKMQEHAHRAAELGEDLKVTLVDCVFTQLKMGLVGWLSRQRCLSPSSMTRVQSASPTWWG